MSSSKISNFASLCLKTIGGILVLSSFLDYLTLAIPFQPLDSQWQIAFVGQMVDRGIVPMVGIGFIVVSAWIEATTSQISNKSFDIKLPAFFLSLLLGGIFLILVPLHLNNLRIVSSSNLAQIEEQTGEAKSRIAQEYEQLKDPQYVTVINQRITEIDRALASGQLDGTKISDDQKQKLTETKRNLENFREIAKNPAELESRLNEVQTRLRSETLDQKNKAKTEVLKQGIRTGISSLLLAIGYLIMGWFGIQSFKNSGGKVNGKQVSPSR